MIMTSKESTFYDDCVFCKIAAKKDANTRVLHETSSLVIFRDIRPASRHHYLVVPKHHVRNPKQLEYNDLELVENLISEGKDFLTKNGGDVDNSRIGFHWPPFTSVNHLHLHIISPARDMGWIASLVFKPKTFWFVTADWLLNRLRGNA